MKITTYIKKNWATLPKSKFDDKELVIVREIQNWEEGYGHHSYKGLGVDENGVVFSATSSGCSCNGDVSTGEDNTELTEDWKDVDFQTLQVEFDNY